MNSPGRPAGNWQWRAPAAAFTDELAGEIAAWNTAAGRARAV